MGVTAHYPQFIAAWGREHNFGAPILADCDHAVSLNYVGLYEDVLPANLRLTSKRAVIGISRDAIVRSLWVTEEPGEGPSDEVVAEAITATKGKVVSLRLPEGSRVHATGAECPHDTDQKGCPNKGQCRT